MTVTMLNGRLFVGGEWVGSSASERTFEVLNPANGEVIATLPDGGKEEMQRAIDTAAEAQGKWGETTAQYRAGITREGEDPGSSRPLLAQRERLHRVAKGCQHVSISACQHAALQAACQLVSKEGATPRCPALDKASAREPSRKARPGTSRTGLTS